MANDAPSHTENAMIRLTDELLLNYKRCNRRTYLEVYGSELDKDPQKEFLLKLRKENRQHIQNFVQERSLNLQKPTASFRDWQLKSQETIALMKEGVDTIFRGMLAISWSDWHRGVINEALQPINPISEDLEFEGLSNNPIANQSDDLSFNFEPGDREITLLANPTLLIKQPGKSVFGDWCYIPVNIKLGRRPKP